MARRRGPSTVFFPWERGDGLRGRLGRARVGIVVVVVATVVSVSWLRQQEEHKASERATRAAISTAERGVYSYRADHGGACPKGFDDVVAGHHLRAVPLDAWGHPLRLTCPGIKDPHGFEISSDGPDGVPGGLDRVE